MKGEKMSKNKKIELFSDAFRSGVGHSVFQCNCGKEFYNSTGGWGWDEGELEELQNSGAIDLDYTVSTILFEGTEYALDCDCWHKRALLIFDFLISHNPRIIELFKLYKQHKQEETDNVVVDVK